MKRGQKGGDDAEEGPGAPELCKRLRQDDSEDGAVDWRQLPEEILLQIFQYLPLLDRAFASQVCRETAALSIQKRSEVTRAPDTCVC
uniref:F-box domain-containing protein n=1 Tax=Cyprinus carpio TaxID=7962 RepID=A0A8C2JM95_CYPCA